MGQFNDAKKLAQGFFHSLQKVNTEASQAPYESLYKSAHAIRNLDVWAEDIPVAGDYTAADANVVANPGMLKKYDKYPLTMVPGSNGQAYYINDGGSFVKDWIAPTDVPDGASKDPSYGYGVRLYKNDDSQVFPTQGAWNTDYYAGLILFGEGNTPGDLGYGAPKITCYQYNGVKGIVAPGLNIIVNQFTAVSGTTNYTLSGTPTSPTKVETFLNGQTLTYGNGFTITANTVILDENLIGYKLNTGMELVVRWY